MAEPVRHRQTKEAATDMFYPKPPRHISTLPLDETARAVGRRGSRHDQDDSASGASCLEDEGVATSLKTECAVERSGYSSVAAAHDRSMKMLDLAPNISKAASAASAISNDETDAIGDAVTLISDKMTSRNSFRWTGSRSFRALKYRFGPCASKIGTRRITQKLKCALFLQRVTL